MFYAGLQVFFFSMLPIVELKGGILWGVAQNLPHTLTFILALIGSSLPVPIILYFFTPLMDTLHQTPVFRNLASFIDNRMHKKSAKMLQSRFFYFALFLFVAIPLPGTGVWSGSAIASFLNLSIKKSLLPIILGNAVAGCAMLLFGAITLG